MYGGVLWSAFEGCGTPSQQGDQAAIDFGNVADRFTDEGSKTQIVVGSHEGVPGATLICSDGTYDEEVKG